MRLPISQSRLLPHLAVFIAESDSVHFGAKDPGVAESIDASQSRYREATRGKQGSTGRRKSQFRTGIVSIFWRLGFPKSGTMLWLFLRLGRQELPGCRWSTSIIRRRPSGHISESVLQCILIHIVSCCQERLAFTDELCGGLLGYRTSPAPMMATSHYFAATLLHMRPLDDDHGTCRHAGVSEAPRDLRARLSQGLIF